jgi:nucleoid-associated protein EbfC
MLGQAQEMQQQMEQRLQSTIVEASSGGGAVSVKMNGKKQVLSLKIDPTAVSGLISSGGSGNAADVEMLEDLIIAALNEAGRRADESLQSGLSGMLSGLNLPGF